MTITLSHGIRSLLVAACGWLLATTGTAHALEFMARHGLTSAQYQTAFNDLGKQGYRLQVVNGYASGTEAHYAALWFKKHGGEWYSRHGLSSGDYQKAFDDFGKRGFRLTHVSAYAVNNEPRYAAIWEKTIGPAWFSYHSLSAADYQKKFDELGAQGFRLKHVSGYAINDQSRFAAIWEKSKGPAWMARHNLTAAEFQKVFDEAAQKGFRLVDISGYSVGNEPRFAAIWEKTSGPAWMAHHVLSAAEFQKRFDELAAQGFHLMTVSGYAMNGQDHYAAIWSK